MTRPSDKAYLLEKQAKEVAERISWLSHERTRLSKSLGQLEVYDRELREEYDAQLALSKALSELALWLRGPADASTG